MLRVKGTTKALALSTDGKARFCHLDPRTGARLVVLEAARNVACTGARPLALVNCLNFGNPEHPEVMWQFTEVVEGMSEACEALGIPVIGGNVCFYNASSDADIHPTPVVGVLGLIDELARRAARRAARGGRVDRRARRDPARARRLGVGRGRARPRRRRAARSPISTPAARLHALVADLVREREVTGVHDVSDGGLAVALCEMAFGGGTGFRVDLADRTRRAVVHRRPRPRSASRRRGSSWRSPAEQVAAVLGAAAAARAFPPR